MFKTAAKRLESGIVLESVGSRRYSQQVSSSGYLFFFSYS